MKQKPTRNAVDSLLEQRYTIKEVAAIFGCSEYDITKIKSRSSAIKNDIYYDQLKSPITPHELREVKKSCRIGDKVRVLNPCRCVRRPNGDWFGTIETARIIRKFPHIVLLDNGLTVDYAEIAMQKRRGN